VPAVLLHDVERLRAEVGPADVGLQELESICASLSKLAPREEVDAAKVAERAREKEVAKRRLAALLSGNPRLAAHADAALRAFNGVPGDPRSFDRLHALLETQAYRLAYWRVAGEEIN
jgi:(1->4)-alpha-D-glucan 1-alpha-D-glucosylmutase